MLQNWIFSKDKMQGTIKELLDALGLARSLITYRTCAKNCVLEI